MCVRVCVCVWPEEQAARHCEDAVGVASVGVAGADVSEQPPYTLTRISKYT